MGQQEILKIMKKNKEYTSKQIQKILKINMGSINGALRRLTKSRFIQRKRITSTNGITYKYKKV